jgi:Histidyl-tRNA synthetase
MELKNKGITGPAVTTTDVFVANLSEDMVQPAFTLTETLRDMGIKADMEHTGRKLKGQFKFADKTGARYVVIMGGEEYERGNIKLRDMQTKEEKEIPLTEAAEAIKALL